ncbi:DUF6920 family protein [Zobellella denitrificans]
MFLLVFILGLGVVVATVIFYGERRWTSGTRELRSRLDAAKLPIEPRIFDSRELETMPAPVQRYFRAVLAEGQPMVAAVSLEHIGTLNLGESADQWKPFTSAQRVVTRRPGFDWDGRVAMMPGLPVLVHDAYIAGEGILHAALLGLLSMAKLRGTGEVARGELMRFLAEAAWYPTALLPSQGVVWNDVDEHAARATLKDGEQLVTLLFHFGEDGLIDTVYAEARGRMMAGRVVPTPWCGRFSNYALRDGLRVPLNAEVAWLLPEGAKPYWRGHITGIAYEFTR